MNLFAVVPAAGSGQRMGAGLPKQYLALQGRKVIDWSVQSLLRQPDIQQVVVVLASRDSHWHTTQVHDDPRVCTTVGGPARAISVLAGLKALRVLANETDWVLVHDAARPCVRETDIQRLVEQMGQGNGIVLGVPVIDTMKRTDAAGHILGTVDRNHLWRAFTPQLFPLGLLYKALEDALSAGVTVTDEASAMEWAGYQSSMLEGASSNIKITRPEDLELAAFYLSHRL